MKISREEFDRRIEEGQNLLLGLLAENAEVSVEKFYKIANVLEYVTLFSGVIYSFVSIATEPSANSKQLKNKTRQA